MRKIKDIYYTSKKNEMQMLDMYLPDEDGFPVFVFFHGGGLEHGDRTHCQCPASYLAPRGVGLISVEYRMYPNAKYPDYIEDAALAVKWVFDNIQSYGGNGKIFVGGSSAGGYLSMMLCFDESFYRAVGLPSSAISGYIHDAGQPTVHFKVLEERGVDPRRCIIDGAAPLYHIGLREKYPPMLFIYSDRDMECRPEQIELTVATLRHFGMNPSDIEVVKMSGTHCEYCGKMEDGESVHGKIMYPFIKRHA